MIKKTTSLMCISCLALTACSKKEDTVSSYTIPKETSQAVTPGQAMPAPTGSTMAPMPGLEAQAASFKQPYYAPPSNWTPQPLDALRKGSWTITSAYGDAEVTVLAFPGNVGGNLANVNRWAKQINHPELTQSEYDALRENIVVSNLEGDYILLHDTTQSEAIAAAIVPAKEGTWFFKMKGDRSTILMEEGSFKDFLKSVVFKD